MTHVDAFRLSVNPISRLSSMARLRHLARPAGQGLLLYRADAVAGGHGAGRRFLDAVGRAADLHPRIHPRASRPDRGGDHHHLDGACAGVR